MIHAKESSMKPAIPRRSVLHLLTLVALIAGLLPLAPALASHTPDPTSVGIPGSYQSEVGCPGDWQPECVVTQLAYDAADTVWQGTWTVPAGNWEYKAALNGSWDENYGANAQQNGSNILLNLAAGAAVKFYYSHATHWITSNRNATIATAPGSYQSEIGCPGDWQPDCLRSWLQDPDGDGVYTFSTTAIPGGNYEVKVAINESWDVNYGAGGVQNGPNIPFTVPGDNYRVAFSFDDATNVLSVQVELALPATLVGSLQSELGCAGDWDPACAATYLTYDANDDVFQRVFAVPAGSYEYKVALNNSWAENYGRNAQRDGPNIPLAADGNPIKFYYDHKSHWITDNRNSVIAVAPGSFQSELGCSGDWDPSCLRSWLQDPDGDGIYTLETTALPAGNYEAKVALNESWDVNYGAGGVQNGPNIPFAVAFDRARVIFSYNAATHALSILTGPLPDNDVWWDGLRHDSRDLLYRTPGGAAPAGTPVTIRFRTYHNDVTGVKVRFYSINRGGQQIVPMELVASDVSCYQDGLPFTCDFWAVTLPDAIVAAPDNLWYRFIVSDGSDTDYYADNTPALDGGLGRTTDDAVDNSYALMIYDPNFEAPAWARTAVIYQIFPDRFRNGNPANDPQTGDLRYDDPVLALDWGTLPEGYCRNYADGATNCPWRFDDTPPDWSPTKESPRGRDYFGGDLKGVIGKLDYLKQQGVTAIYFNPIFAAKSNHRYDTADYYQIDPALGTLQDFQKLVSEARKRGIRILVDGVFNHLSSDSPFFDRYDHYAEVGACESAASAYRSWFYFRAPLGLEPSPCAPSTAGGSDTYYDGWFGFDSIPVIRKTLAAVQDYFINNPNSVTRYWLQKGAAAWRMDVMGDSSFPSGYWEAFRQVVKRTSHSALIISETWQKDSTLLRMLRGDRADTTMNYRLRDAVIGLLTPGPFDSKGFADSGRILAPSEFAARVESIREDYPDAAFYTLMNLLDSHDTERLLWTLTPGAETTADKELNAANVTIGKQRVRLASLIQFTLPGAPTVYYGDEAGMTGDDDPDDRRTFPWPDTGGTLDTAMQAHYRRLAELRRHYPQLTGGDLRVLLADDAAGVVAYGRKARDAGAVVVINRSFETRTVDVPLAGYMPEGTSLSPVYAVGNPGLSHWLTVTGGVLHVTLNPNSGALFITPDADLTGPEAPITLQVTSEGNGQVGLAWNAVTRAAGYNVYRSPLSGGGFVKVNPSPITNLQFIDTGLRNARLYYYVVRAVDVFGNEGHPSNEVSALPHYAIGWANLQWPPTLNHTISAVNRTGNVYGQVWIDGVTSQPGPTVSLRAQLGFGPDGSQPANNPAWTWVDASFNVDVGNNDEFVASLLPEAVGAFDYAYRYTTTDGRDWLYADLDGIQNGYDPAQAGSLTVLSSGDTTPPAAPTGLRVVSASPAGVALAWDAVVGDPTLYGYEVLRGDASGGPYTQLARVTATSFVDTAVAEGATYYYLVRSVDLSFNRSGNSAEVAATAALRTVTLVLNVAVPTPVEDAIGRSVYIAGTLDRLDGNLPQWNPGGVVLTRVNDNLWTITLTGKETTQIEYKYTLGSWDFVEKDAACGEIANRQLTLSYGASGTQIVNDTVPQWRNVAPCGN
jgi:glycosidase